MATNTLCSCGTLRLIFVVILASYLTSPVVEGTREPPRKLQIAIPIFENMTMLDAVGPYEILNTLPFVHVTFVSFKRGPISDLGSMTMEAKASFDEVHKILILLAELMSG